MILPKTKFITFYSFKGGVGRTMALLHCGAILASRGRRVLMIDFDLDAPGLSFLSNHFGGPDPQETKGLVELVTKFKSEPSASFLNMSKQELRRHFFGNELALPKEWQLSKGQEVVWSLLPAAGLDVTFSHRLAEIDWRKGTLAHLGVKLLEALKKILSERKWYDYVLVDSRTGFCDESHLSIKHLADHLIAFSGLNDQNLNGMAKFLHKMENHWQFCKDGKQIVLAAGPVPEWPRSQIDKRKQAARSIFQNHKLKGDYSFKVELPYYPALALGESLVPPEAHLGKAYVQLCNELQGLTGDTAYHWRAHIEELFEGEGLEAGDIDNLQNALRAIAPLDNKDFSGVADFLLYHLPEHGRERHHYRSVACKGAELAEKVGNPSAWVRFLALEGQLTSGAESQALWAKARALCAKYNLRRPHGLPAG